MVARRKFRATTVGAASVTLTQQGPEHEPGPGNPNVWGSGTVVVNTTATPDAEFWKTFAASGREYLVEITVMS